LAGITDESQRGVIIKDKVKQLYVAYDIEEFLNIEKNDI